MNKKRKNINLLVHVQQKYAAQKVHGLSVADSRVVERVSAQHTLQRAEPVLCVCVCVMWCGVVWCGVVWCGVVWCGVVWCGVGCGVV
jgi:hypothetical protein